MEYTTTNKSGNSLVLSSSFTPEEITALKQEAMQTIASKMHIRGFRPGKAPLSVVASYVDDEEVKDEILKKTASQVYVKFLKESKETDSLIFEPEVIKAAWDTADKGLVLDMRVFELPKADHDFWSAVEVEDVHIEVSKAVENRIHALVDAVTETSPKEAPVAHGDLVAVSIKTPNAQNPHHTELTVGEGEVGTKYEPIVLGMSKGDTKHFSLPMQENTLEGDLTIESVAEKHVPEINDEFAKSVGSFSSLAELQKALHDEEEQRAQQNRRDTLFARAIEAAVQKQPLEFPAYVRQDAAQQRLAEVRESLTQNGLSLSEYLKYNNITTEQFGKDVEAEAVKLLQRDLLMEATERACSISADDSEVSAYAEGHKDELQKENVNPANDEGHRIIRNIIVWDKTRDAIVDAIHLKESSDTKGDV